MLLGMRFITMPDLLRCPPQAINGSATRTWRASRSRWTSSSATATAAPWPGLSTWTTSMAPAAPSTLWSPSSTTTWRTTSFPSPHRRPPRQRSPGGRSGSPRPPRPRPWGRPARNQRKRLLLRPKLHLLRPKLHLLRPRSPPRPSPCSQASLTAASSSTTLMPCVIR